MSVLALLDRAWVAAQIIMQNGNCATCREPFLPGDEVAQFPTIQLSHLGCIPTQYVPDPVPTRDAVDV